MKQFIQKIATATISLAMMLSLAAMPVLAVSTPDTQTTPVVATATSTANITVATGNANDLLSAYKVVETEFNPETNTLSYSFSDVFTAFKQSPDGSTYSMLTPEAYAGYASDSAELKALLGALSSYIKKQSPQPIANYAKTTNTSGAATFSNVAMGQYIILGSGNTTGAYVYQTVTAEVVPSIQNGQYVIYPAYNVTMKTTKPTATKDIITGTIKDGENEKAKETTSIGDTVTYQLKATVPVYSDGATNTTFFMSDTLSNGLTLKSESGALEVHGYNTTTGANGVLLTIGQDYTIQINGQTLYIDFKYKNIKGFDSLAVKYDAILNENALIGTATGNPNTYDLIYSNDPFNGSTSDTHPSKETPGYGHEEKVKTVYTYALLIDKFEKANKNIKLSGATFEIYTGYTEGTYSGLVATIATDDNGYAAYKGLAAGTYFLKETKAPTGYKLLTTPITITINQSASSFAAVATTMSIDYTTDTDAASIKVQAINENGEKLYLTASNDVTTVSEGNNPAYVKAITSTVTNGSVGEGTSANGYYMVGVANVKGSSLPSTGGMGTVIFTIIGLALMTGAAVILIAKKRMANKEQ